LGHNIIGCAGLHNEMENVTFFSMIICKFDIHQFNQKPKIIVFKSYISKVKKNSIKLIWFLKVSVILFTLPSPKFEA
jgi:hypothetical protein